MADQPWIKFYPRDWRGDQALRAVSLAARGLWMEMLCIMHEASPYGHLILGDRPVENAVLARMSGTGVDEVSALLIELESAGVFSRTRRGVIFSRRMTKDKGRAEKGRKAVAKRWSQSTEKIAQNGQPNRSPDRKPTTQKPEARYQKESIPPAAERETPRGGPDPVITRVMSAGRFVQIPPDTTLVRDWMEAGADLEKDILPTLERETESLIGRTGRGPLKLKVFDNAVRRKLADDAAETERLRRSAARMKRLVEEQDQAVPAPRRAAR